MNPVSSVLSALALAALSALSVLACSSSGQVDETRDVSKADDANNGGSCAPGEDCIYKAPGCSDPGVCYEGAYPTCYEEFCGCDGKTLSGCGSAFAPYAHKGACKDSSADAATDSGACTPPKALWYDKPGCGVDAVPVCSNTPPPCATEYCSCDNKTIIGCGLVGQPYKSVGKCSKADASTP